VTVNDYLAQRDKEWMSPVFEFHGLSVGVILNSMHSFERKQQYLCDITWPKVFKVDYGQEEAAALQGEDPRRYCMMTKKFLDHATGELQAVEVSKVEWVMDEGRYVPRPVSGTEEILPSQLVLLAMGFIGPEENLLQQLQITQDGRGNIRADETNCRTNKPGIFAAGDARRGQSLVVWAINEGRAAARECDRYLMGTTCLP